MTERGAGVRAKRSARWAGVASVLWLLVADASAQVPQQPRQGREAHRGGPQRMVSAEPRPESLLPRDAEPPGGGNRLSPEERRQLRRDVQEAGRELYPGRMSQGRRESGRQ